MTVTSSKSPLLQTDLSMMPHMSICRLLWFPSCFRCTWIRSTRWPSTAMRRMQPWKTLKGFLHSDRLSSSAGQPEVVEEKAGRNSGSPTFLWNYADRFSRLRNLSHVTHVKTGSVAVAFEHEAKLRLQVTYRWHRLGASNSSVSRQLSFKTVWIYTKSHSNLCFLEDFCWLSASICF